MSALADIKEECNKRNISYKSYIQWVRLILNVYGKDLRSDPLVRKVWNAIKDYSQEDIEKAYLVFYKKATETESKIHINYFIVVLERIAAGAVDKGTTNGNNNEIVMWGKLV